MMNAKLAGWSELWCCASSLPVGASAASVRAGSTSGAELESLQDRAAGGDEETNGARSGERTL